MPRVRVRACVRACWWRGTWPTWNAISLRSPLVCRSARLDDTKSERRTSCLRLPTQPRIGSIAPAPAAAASAAAPASSSTI